MKGLSSLLQIRKKDRGLVYSMDLTLFCSGMAATLFGAILPSMQSEYGMSYALTGMLLSAHQAGTVVAVLLIGILPYIIGRKKSWMIMTSGIMLGLVGLTLTGNPFVLLLSFFLTGIGRGASTNITNVVVSECAGNRTAGVNVLQAFFALGAFISPFVAMFAVSRNWRYAPWMIAAVVLCDWIIVGSSSLSDRKVERTEDTGSSGFYKDFDFWIVTFILFFYLCSEGSLTGWLVTYFKDEGIMSTSLAQLMQSLLWVMIFLGRLTCAAIASRVNKPVLILIQGIMMLLSFLLMIISRNTSLIVLGLLGLGYFMGGIYPTVYSTLDPRYSSSTFASGICMGTATMGAIIMPTIIGSVAEKSGIYGGVATISVALFSLVVLMITKLFRYFKSTR